jgi:transposase
LADAEWKQLKPLIPEALPGRRSRKTDIRAAMNAIFYLLRTGCPWRYLARRISAAENILPSVSMNGSIFIREVFWRRSKIMEDQIVMFIEPRITKLP